MKRKYPYVFRSTVWSVLILYLVLLLSSCGKAEAPLKTMPAAPDDTAAAGIAAADTAADAEKDLPADSIPFTFQSYPVQLMQGKKPLAAGNYLSVTLSDDAASLYPALKSRLEAFNEEQEKELKDYLSSVKQEVLRDFENGPFPAYEENCRLIPLRADEKAFSFLHRTAVRSQA